MKPRKKLNDSKLSDEKNPEFLFNLTDTELLVKIVKGEIDPIELAKKQLKNRYLDMNGNWERKN